MDIDDDAPDPMPLYVGVCQRVIDDIADGKVRAGALLPSAQYLAIEHGCSVVTVRRGLRLARRLGWARYAPQWHRWEAAVPERM